MTAEVVDYLRAPPTRDEFLELLRMLGMKPGDLIRRGEAVFQEFYAGRDLSDAEALDAVLARPPKRVHSAN